MINIFIFRSLGRETTPPMGWCKRPWSWCFFSSYIGDEFFNLHIDLDLDYMIRSFYKNYEDVTKIMQFLDDCGYLITESEVKKGADSKTCARCHLFESRILAEGFPENYEEDQEEIILDTIQLIAASLDKLEESKIKIMMERISKVLMGSAKECPDMSMSKSIFSISIIPKDIKNPLVSNSIPLVSNRVP